MSHITIAGGLLKNDTVANNLLAEVTRVVRPIVGCPLGKISVRLQAILLNRWNYIGVTGYDPDFVNKNCRKVYEKLQDLNNDI
ncbi:hypothetical protein RHO12_11625 [Orbus sturtevantii]|uniref:hypothetical protein n=1 Tax=Orbus sturtevantii TaxID=3074109 RepID=UPI00370D9D38